MLSFNTVQNALSAALNVAQQMPDQNLKNDVFDIVLNALLDEALKHGVVGWSMPEIANIVQQVGTCYNQVSQFFNPHQSQKEFQTAYRTILKKVIESWAQERNSTRPK